MHKTDKSSRYAPIVFILCGAVTALPFIVGGTFLISWISLSPAIYILMRDCAEMTKRRAYLLGACLGCGYFGVMYHWFAYLYPMDFAGLNGFSSVLVIIVCWLGLAALQSFEMGFVTLIYKLFAPKERIPVRGCILFICLWVIFEWQQTLGWRGVPWGRLALSQSSALPFLQSASLFGSAFVSALIVAVNACIASAVLTAHRARADAADVISDVSVDVSDDASVGEPTDRIGDVSDSETKLRKKLSERLSKLAACVWGALKKQRSVRTFAITAAALFSVNALFGVIRMAIYDENEGDAFVAAVIQGNISSTDKWADDHLITSSDLCVSLTRECVEETGAKLVVWPETVIPAEIDSVYYLRDSYKELARELDIVLVVGAFDDVGDDEYNALIFFLPDGTEGDTRYYKRRLVPFGESLPLEGFIRVFLPILLDLNLVSEPLTEGDSTAIAETPLCRLGSLICFDSIYPSLTLDTVRDGAELIVLSTNDSWFSDSAAVYQHDHHAALRAIESGRYVVRAANTGISSVISPEGRQITEIEPLVSGHAAATVYARSDRTLYSYIGDVFIYGCMIFAVFTAVSERVKRRSRR